MLARFKIPTPCFLEKRRDEFLFYFFFFFGKTKLDLSLTIVYVT